MKSYNNLAQRVYSFICSNVVKFRTLVTLIKGFLKSTTLGLFMKLYRLNNNNKLYIDWTKESNRKHIVGMPMLNNTTQTENKQKQEFHSSKLPINTLFRVEYLNSCFQK